jgi:hypothetical protein
MIASTMEDGESPVKKKKAKFFGFALRWILMSV